MKKMLYFATLILAVGVFANCSKDDPEYTNSNGAKHLVKSIYFKSSDEEYAPGNIKYISYDSKGRVASYDGDKFSYSGNTLTITSRYDQTVATLNSQGYITNLKTSYYGEAFSVGMNFEYDKGYLVGATATHFEDGIADDHYQYTLTWETGNLAKVEELNDGDRYIYKMFYDDKLTNKKTNINMGFLCGAFYFEDGNEITDYLGVLGFLGKASKNLYHSSGSGYSEDVRSDESYIYTIESDGKITNIRSRMNNNYSDEYYDIILGYNDGLSSQNELEIDQTELYFYNTQDSKSIDIYSSAKWTAEVLNAQENNWCTISPTSGQAGNGSILITVSDNDTGATRAASIIVKNDALQKVIKVSQSNE